jgi:predicted ATPase
LLDRRSNVRLVTLTGPSGAGKTHLALQAAAELLDDFADGVWFVNWRRSTIPIWLPPPSHRRSACARVGDNLSYTL